MRGHETGRRKEVWRRTVFARTPWSTAFGSPPDTTAIVAS